MQLLLTATLAGVRFAARPLRGSPRGSSPLREQPTPSGSTTGKLGLFKVCFFRQFTGLSHVGAFYRFAKIEDHDYSLASDQEYPESASLISRIANNTCAYFRLYRTLRE
jgi:hypothetical protein